MLWLFLFIHENKNTFFLDRLYEGGSLGREFQSSVGVIFSFLESNGGRSTEVPYLGKNKYTPFVIDALMIGTWTSSRGVYSICEGF